MSKYLIGMISVDHDSPIPLRAQVEALLREDGSPAQVSKR